MLVSRSLELHCPAWPAIQASLPILECLNRKFEGILTVEQSTRAPDKLPKTIVVRAEPAACRSRRLR